MMKFFIMISIVNAILAIVSEVRCRMIKAKYNLHIRKSTKDELLRTIILIFLPIVNMFGFLVVLYLCFASEDGLVRIFEKAGE